MACRSALPTLSASAPKWSWTGSTSYIETGIRLYAQTGKEQFAEQTFEAAEEGRAASLRSLWAGPDLAKRMPGEYWQALTDLYKAESKFVKGETAANATAIRGAELKLAEMEARAGLDFPRAPGASDANGAGAIERTRKTLRPSEVYLGFHLGDSESCLWIVAREGFDERRLPGRAQLVEAIGRFVKALRETAPDARGLGNGLYAQLFGGANHGLLDKPVWIVAPDGALFELPFAALTEPAQSDPAHPVYVVERHAVRIVSELQLFPVRRRVGNNVVVGLGDPIYNRADRVRRARRFLLATRHSRVADGIRAIAGPAAKSRGARPSGGPTDMIRCC